VVKYQYYLLIFPNPDLAVDTAKLQELKRAASLIEAPNTDKKPDIKKLQKVLVKAENMKERNKLIVQSYQKSYSQYMIAKVLEENFSLINTYIICSQNKILE